MDEYQIGNREIIDMIENGHFDLPRAKELLCGEDLNKPIRIPIPGCNLSYSTTYLCEAVSSNNLPAVAFLLDNGADPNLYIPDIDERSALWELQYIEPEQDWKIRYEIAKLFFSHGADPDLTSDNEALYDYVCFKVFNEDPNDKNDWENLRHLFLLLVIYGSNRKATGYERAVLKDIDLSRIDEYDIVISPYLNTHKLIGKLIDGNRNEIAII